MAQDATKKLTANPTSLLFLDLSADSDENSPGGHVQLRTAGSTLLWGDLVFIMPSGRVDKHLNASWYHSRFLGVVVGGSVTGYQASTDSSLIGKTMSTAGQKVIVQTDGLAYIASDNAAGATYSGQPLLPGQTTAGRGLALAGNTGSYATTDSGFAIHGAASAVGKVTTATQVIISGALGTAITAADTAALSGTVTNAKFNVYEARSTGGANETTAMGTEAATLAGVVLPAAPAVGVATYGVIIVNPTGTGNFVGGTTALDDGTVIPNAVFMQLRSRYGVLGWFVETGGGAGVAKLVRIAPE